MARSPHLRARTGGVCPSGCQVARTRARVARMERTGPLGPRTASGRSPGKDASRNELPGHRTRSGLARGMGHRGRGLPGSGRAGSGGGGRGGRGARRGVGALSRPARAARRRPPALRSATAAPRPARRPPPGPTGRPRDPWTPLRRAGPGRVGPIVSPGARTPGRSLAPEPDAPVAPAAACPPAGRLATHPPGPDAADPARRGQARGSPEENHVPKAAAVCSRARGAFGSGRRLSVSAHARLWAGVRRVGGGRAVAPTSPASARAKPSPLAPAAGATSPSAGRRGEPRAGHGGRRCRPGAGRSRIPEGARAISASRDRARGRGALPRPPATPGSDSALSGSALEPPAPASPA